MLSEPQAAVLQLRSKDDLPRMEIPHPNPLGKPTAKVLIPNNNEKNENNKASSAQIFPPSAFASRSVAVNTSDIQLKTIICNFLKAIGSNICSETNPMVDFIISDKPIRIVPMPINYRSRGKRLAAAIHGPSEISQPRVVLLHQIPWIFQNKKNSKEEKEVHESVPFNGIVVADESHAKRPLFKAITKMPILYFNDVPRGYTFTPFTQPPQDPTQLIQKFSNYSKDKEQKKSTPLGPADNGFCEICGCSFKSAQAHYESPAHQGKCKNSSTWAAFDEISNIM